MKQHFYSLLIIGKKGELRLVDNSAIAFVKNGYQGAGLTCLEDLLEILKTEGKIQIMDGFNYPEDVFEEITLEDLKDSQVYFSTNKLGNQPIENLGKLDIMTDI